ncbi:MAG: hypothetical protein HRT74_06025, partial [Flavobacteriales bacterium]|nr:hypothetical protein [Flavobacteriales bacterium]
MNKEQLERYLRLEFDDQAVESLQELVETYPYFQAGHALLAKASKEKGHHRYDEYLQKAAIYTHDRQALFDLIMKDKIASKIQVIEQEIELLDETAVKDEPENDTLDEVEELKPEEVEVSDSSGEEQDQQSLATETLQDNLVVEEEVETITNLEEVALSEEEVAEPLNLDQMDDLQKEVLVEAVSRSLELEASEFQNEEQEKEEEQVEEEVSKEEIVSRSDPNDDQVLDAFTSWVYKRAVQMNYTSPQGETTTKQSPEEEE